MSGNVGQTPPERMHFTPGTSADMTPCCDCHAAELRARAEKAEAAYMIAEESADRWCRTAQDRWHSMRAAIAERDTLRDGIQALADTYHGYGAKCFPGGDFADDLRGLLSPTTEGPTT